MKERLKLEEEKTTGDQHQVSVTAAIDIADNEGSRIAGHVLLTEKCFSYKEFEEQILQIKEQLDNILDKSRQIFEPGVRNDYNLEFNENLTDEELWNIMSQISDVGILLEKFNGMSYEKRVEVADYILSHANIFSGAGSVFSERYNSEKGILE